MKVRYKIIAGFMLFTLFVLSSFGLFVYYYTDAQHKKDFEKRLRNRASTVSAMLFKFPLNEYQFLSQLDSATNNLLVSENINVYNTRNQLIYRYAKRYTDTVHMDVSFLKQVRIDRYYSFKRENRQIVAEYFDNNEYPVVVIVSAIDENGLENLRDLRRSLFAAFICGIILSFLSGWAFSRRILRPITRISKEVKEISAKNIGNRLHESIVKDEWQDLTSTFNNLLTRLQDSFEIQGRFISNASHELSTPLTSVANQIDVILQKQRSNDEYLSVLRSVKADIQHMSALTQQLLSLANTARGGTIRAESIRVDEIIMELPVQLKKINTAYIVQIHFDEFPEDEQYCTVNGSYELLLSACKNIAENACKYAPDHTAAITLSFIQDKIVVQFRNRISGMILRNLDDIFHPFQRGENVAGHFGYGLGLSLARRIILLHNGEVTAQELEQSAFVMTVTLPVAR